MKQLLLVMCMLCFSSLAGLAPQQKALYILQAEPIRPYEKIWLAVCKVESNFNPYAIGDVHLKNKSYGMVQIRQVRLDDYYQQTGIRYNTKQMFDTVRSKSVFMFYATQYRPDEIEKISRCWNGGVKGMKKRSIY